jgi:hypothetical protein
MIFAFRGFVAILNFGANSFLIATFSRFRAVMVISANPQMIFAVILFLGTKPRKLTSTKTSQGVT